MRKRPRSIFFGSCIKGFQVAVTEKEVGESIMFLINKTISIENRIRKVKKDLS